MNNEKIKRVAYLTVAALGTILFIYLFFKYLFMLALPFLIAATIAYSSDKPTAVIHKKLKLPARVVRLSLTLLSTLAFLGALGIGVWRASVWLADLLSGGGLEQIGEMIGMVTSSLGGILGEVGNGVGDAVYSLLSSFLTSLGGFLSSFVGGIPKAILFLLVTVISSVYFSLDLEFISDFLRKLLPQRVVSYVGRLKNSLLVALVRYLRSYLLLMLMTFGVMLGGLILLRVKNPLALGIVIALLDVLPVIGVGTVLLPWSVYCFLVGDTMRGVGFILLYAVHTVIRQLAEPKIVGKNLGVHPIVTLVLLYVGYSLFGFLGLLLVPVFTVAFEVLLGEKYAPKVDKPATAK